ncbi:hypothetical protein DBR43_10160 [Pedobacter sp. KBW06]|uniref:PKD-like family lipoprotein n=1 Tax=Pedobacter sp. KBW06 TaxID=2153359 RepID=UPI000F5AC65D|nr:PKD-like family lipoprotein [Pedobacter sp. KBW06]RQO75691.1 hypothetical protein DBR43_10160 [Pedobacter sp. KBW06]
MKTIKKYTGYIYSCFAVLLILSGCAKDRGNYEYKKLNEVKIDSIPNFSLMKFDSLKISAGIRQSESSQVLSYEWKIYSPKTGKTKVLSKEKNLAVIIAEEPITDAYELVFKATDPSTGISEFRSFSVKVVTPFSEGWMVLNRKGNDVDIDMVNPAGKIFSDIFKLSNGKAIPGGASRIYTYYGQQEQKVFVQTASDILQLKGNDFIQIQNYNSLFYEQPAPARPELYFLKKSGDREFIINDGSLYVMATSVPPPTRFGAKIPGDYKAAGFMAVGSKYPGIIYDEKNGGFLVLPANKSELVGLPVVEGAAFDMNKINKTMVFMQPAPVLDHFYALFKDPRSQSFHFYAINSNGTNPAVKYQQMANVPDIGRASTFAISSTLPLIYYAVGQKIYVYDVEMNAARKVFEIPFASANIMALRMLNGALVAGVNEGEEGKLYYFELAPTGNIASNTKKISGLGKIIDLVYKPQ